MKRIGYFQKSHLNNTCEIGKEMIELFKCSKVFIDESSYSRPKWTEFINSLEEEDTVVISSIKSCFKSMVQLRFFVKLCHDRRLRLISIEDKVDTEMEYFGTESIWGVLNALIALPSKGKGNETDLASDYEAEIEINNYKLQMVKKNRLVINMYLAGYTIKEIMDKVGYQGKSNVFRVLHQHGIRLRHPRKPSKKSDNSDIDEV